MSTMILLIFCVYFASFISVDHGKKVAMKVVEEPSNFGVNNGYQDNTAPSTLKMRITPSNFSGPAHLRMLYGSCIDKVINDYKYEICPFVNITQHEQSLRWNPYSGVLGVWQEWEIHNNTFVAMVMREGDSCGSVFRSVRVLLQCGTGVEIDSVSEPATCAYQLVLKTPLVCHPHAMLVYPTLSRDLQHRWDQVEGQLQAGLITKQGYNKLLHKIFEDAGYVLSAQQKEVVSKSAVEEKQSSPGGDEGGKLDTLEHCKEEYAKLKQEVKGLKALLELNGIKNNVSSSSDVVKKDTHEYYKFKEDEHYNMDPNHLKDMQYHYEDDLHDF